jgi:hypothetical protein
MPDVINNQFIKIYLSLRGIFCRLSRVLCGEAISPTNEEITSPALSAGASVGRNTLLAMTPKRNDIEGPK